MYFVSLSQITADSHDLTSILTFAMLVLIDTGIVYWVSVHQCTCTCWFASHLLALDGWWDEHVVCVMNGHGLGWSCLFLV